MTRWNDPMLRNLVAKVAQNGQLSTEQALKLLQEVRDSFYPPEKPANGDVFFYNGHKIQVGYCVRGSRVVFNEMVTIEGVVTAVNPYMANGVVNAILDVHEREYDDWLGCHSLVFIKDEKGNILWQDACYLCRKPALYLNTHFKPVCEYCVS